MKKVNRITRNISNNTKLKSPAARTLLTLSTKLLLAADIGYHKSCYDVFCSPKWNKKKNVEENNRRQSSVDELLNLTEYLVVVKKEIYALAQLRGFYDEISDDNSRVLRSIAIKKKFRIESKTK